MINHDKLFSSIKNMKDLKQKLRKTETIINIQKIIYNHLE